jgi:ubiquitin C-terminal hydrolase
MQDNRSLLQLAEGSQLAVMGTKTGKELKMTGDITIASIKIDEPKKQERFGLTNIGNTCYMNAAIQFLRSVPKINQFIRNIKPISSQTGRKEQAIGISLASVLK